MSVANKSHRNSSPFFSDPDVRLMLEFQKGNKSSFEALMRKYFPLILNFTYRYIGNRETAEDLTQEVFIRVYNSAARYSPRSRFKTWIYTIAKNISINELRRLKRAPASLDEHFKVDDDKLRSQMADQNITNPDDKMIQTNMISIIRAAVNDLPVNQRTAVILRRYDDFSYHEISKVMNLSVGAVKSLLNRARKNLKNKMGHLIDNEHLGR
jgi:RNA polymerase sigma-70 factor (ECF subfamily)